MLYYFCLKNNYQLRRFFMYIQQEKQNVCYSRENENPVNWMPAFAGMTGNAKVTTSTNINLKRLSNDQLLLQAKNLVQKERQINIQVLQHLQEIERRKLYLKRGFPSLFEYAIKEPIKQNSKL